MCEEAEEREERWERAEEAEDGVEARLPEERRLVCQRWLD